MKTRTPIEYLLTGGVFILVGADALINKETFAGSVVIVIGIIFLLGALLYYRHG